ncbi:MAG: hypothetical protein KDD64_12915 [Bdellovibrionales bacterium]|nr:hypothetical protein [Bdellovibrionales bacterium]
MGLFGFGSNLASLQAQRQLGATRNTLGEVFERLASGQRINRASDDAASLAISDGLSVRSRIATQGMRNINDAISLLNIADGSTESLTAIVTRQKELAQQAANGIFSDTQRSALNAEYQSLSNEYDRLIASTKFNGLNILSSGFGRLNIEAGGSSVVTDILPSLGTSVTESLGSSTNIDLGGGSIAGGVVVEEDQRLLKTDFNSDGIDDLIAIGFELSKKGANGFLTVQTFLGGESGPTLADSYSVQVGTGGTATDFQTFAAQTKSNGRADIDIQYVGGATSLGRLDFQTDGTIIGFTAGLTTVVNQSSTSITGDFNGDGYNDSASTAFSIATNDPVHFVLSNLITTSTDLGTISLLRNSTDILSVDNARTALDSLDDDLDRLSQTRASIGASLSRIETANSLLSSKRVELDAASDRIRSADLSVESARLVQQRIKEQAAAAVLAQANSQPRLALSLLQV